MKNGQGFLLVFSITSPSSLAELHGLREEILRIKDREEVPIVIIGNKADLEDQRAIPRTNAFSISQQWGAPYYEASARTRSKSSWHGQCSGVIPGRALTRDYSKRRRGVYRHMPTNVEGRRRHGCLGRDGRWQSIQARRLKTEAPAEKTQEQGPPSMCYSLIRSTFLLLFFIPFRRRHFPHLDPAELDSLHQSHAISPAG